MGSYILNFMVYTMAMCGLICFALFVYKKFAVGNFLSKNSQFLNIEESLSLAPRKMLYVIRAGEERFLIASDVDKTTLVSKLDANTPVSKALSTSNPMDFEAQLNQVNPVEQKVQPSHQRQIKKPALQPQAQPHNYSKAGTAGNYQPKTPEYSGKTTYIGLDDFPEIKTSKKPKSSNDIIKSMVNRVKG